MTKIRLDEYLLIKNLAPTRQIAQSLIMQGLVHNQNSKLTKPGEQVRLDALITVKRRRETEYVSRAALKLAEGLKHFKVSAMDKICLDIGAAAGGFTEILLEAGAKLVYSVDVAYGEIHNSLREHERIVLLERTNARHLSRELIPLPLELIVCDASFIRLENILPASLKLASPNFQLIALIKPQFEAEKWQVEAGGLITDDALHEAICNKVKAWLEAEMGLQVKGIIPSPIKGMKGNKEFLICAEREA